MIKKYCKGICWVFIDAANIIYSQKTLGWKVDYEKLIKYLQENCNLGKIIYYTAYDPENKKQRKFLDKLEIIGMKVRKKPLKLISDDSIDEDYIKKGNLDVELTIDAVENKDKYDTIILMSGDSDFSELIKHLRKFNKESIVISTQGHISMELIQQCRKYINLRKLKSKLEFNK